MKIQIKRTLLLLFIAIITAAAAVMVIMTTTGSDHGAQPAAESPQDAQFSAERGGIKQIVAGEEHTMVLFNNGALYVVGSNEYGQVGQPESVPALYEFTRVKLNEDYPVTYIAASTNYSMAICNGELYATGDCTYGQLGLSIPVAEVNGKKGYYGFKKVSGISNITSIGCGGSHSMLISDGELYAAGYNANGNLGMGNKTSLHQYTKVTTAPSVGFDGGSVACGTTSSFAITNNKEVYVVGWGGLGQLGIPFPEPEKTTSITNFQQVSDVTNVSSISCKVTHTVIQRDNDIYITGNNDYGQLGLGDNNNRNEFTKVDTTNIGTVTSAVAGSRHTTILNADGKVYVAGKNIEGQLGLGNNDSKTTFTQVSGLSDKKITMVAVGNYTTFAVTDDGELYATGQNNYGQLGLGDKTNRNTFTKVSFTYTVNFDSNDGSNPDGASTTQTMPYNKIAMQLQENPFTKEGCTFVGWATSKEKANDGTVEYKDNERVTCLANVNESTILYAVWKPDAPEVNITTKDSIDTIIYNDNGSITLIANTSEFTDIEYKYQWLYKGEEDAGFAAVNYATEKTLVRKNVNESGLYKVIVIATLTDKNVKSEPTTSEAKQITINRAALPSPEVSIENWKYGEDAKDPVVTGNLGEGLATYHYSGKTNGGIEYDSTDQPTDAGNYTVTATIPETANYLGTSVEQNFSIDRAEQTFTVEVDGWTYGETPNDPVVSGNDGECEYLYTGKANNNASYNSSKAPSKAGEYTVTATAAETDNYKAGTAEPSAFKIERATLTAKLTLENWTYGGTPSIPVLKGNDGNGTVLLTYNVKKPDGETDLHQEYDGLAALDKECAAGRNYTLDVVIEETADYNRATVSVSFNVDRKKISAPEILSKVYNGYAQTAGIVGNDDYQEQTPGEEFGPKRGEYNVVLTLTDPVNTEWEDGKGTIDVDNKEKLTLKFRIVGAENSWTTEPSIPNVKYGEKISPKYAAAYENEKVMITYYKDNNELTGAPTAVGHYKATFTIDETMEYTGLVMNTEFDISPKDITVTIEDKCQVYNGKELELTWSTPDGSIIEKDDLGIELSREPGKDAGAYAITGKWNNNGNYNVTFKNGIYTIAKATYDMKNVAFAGKTVTYDGNEYGLEVTGLPAGVSVEYTGNNKTNAGEYTITATFTAADTKNYEELATKELTATLKIARATYDMKNVAFAGKTVTYDGSVHSLKVTGLPVGVSVEYTGNNKTNAGEYTITATFTAVDTKNYEELATKELTATLKIEKAKYDMKNVAFAGKTVTYDGSVHSLKVTGLPAGVSVEYAENNKTNAGEYLVTATFTAADTKNYEELETKELTATLTIEKAKYDVSGVEFAGKDVTYNGETHSLYVDGLPAGVSVKYVGNDKRNAGTYEVTAVFTVDENHEAIGTMTATLNIAKAKYTMPTFESKTVTYDGNIHSLVVTGLPYGVTVEYEGNGNKEAGTYTVTAKFTGDANYEALGDLTATLTIEEKGGCGSVVVDGATIAGIAISVLAFAAIMAVRKAKSKKN